MRDLDLLVEAALGLVRPALALDDQLAPADLESDVVRADAGELRLDDRARGLAAVVHVDVRGELPPSPARATFEDVAEQLVDLAPHALEVRKEITLSGHPGLGYPPPPQASGRRLAGDQSV